MKYLIYLKYNHKSSFEHFNNAEILCNYKYTDNTLSFVLYK